MTAFMMVIHALVCILLATIILMQSGRGGGLTESFSSAESMFGAQTSSFLIKGTTILSTCFLVTCLGLAILSSKKSQSLMSTKIAPSKQTSTVDSTAAVVDQAVEEAESVQESIPQP
ncbi:MAG: preprotein translocase subunit SecG [Candidatus Omnitrophica bacterium]|nr:preprotein translocase subunit SecG [Candidatus Omnitrophota bacterium]MCB9748159.1 preprotein translocase subunit SecG [Candidatus Omnitrophota bacterium]